jgi:vacuolar-type H+-ATPase subunit I/STV1
MNFEKMPNTGEEKENNLEEMNENEVEEKVENELENSAEGEMSEEQLEQTKEDIKEIETLATEFDNYSEEQIQEKYKSSSTFREKLDKAKIVLGAIGVAGSYAAAFAFHSGSDMKSAMIAVAGVVGTALAMTIISPEKDY